MLHCADSHFTCVSDGACIPKTQTCNGHPNCADGSDEAASTCGEWLCSVSVIFTVKAVDCGEYSNSIPVSPNESLPFRDSQ